MNFLVKLSHNRICIVWISDVVLIGLRVIRDATALPNSPIGKKCRKQFTWYVQPLNISKSSRYSSLCLTYLKQNIRRAILVCFKCKGRYARGCGYLVSYWFNWIPDDPCRISGMTNCLNQVSGSLVVLLDSRLRGNDVLTGRCLMTLWRWIPAFAGMTY